MGLAVKCLFLLVVVATLASFAESRPHNQPAPKFDNYKKGKKSYDDDYDDHDDYYEDHDSHYDDDDCEDDHDHYDCGKTYQPKKKAPPKKYDYGKPPPKKQKYDSGCNNNYKSCGCDDDCDCGGSQYEQEYNYGKKQEYGYGKKSYKKGGYGKKY